MKRADGLLGVLLALLLFSGTTMHLTPKPGQIWLDASVPSLGQSSTTAPREDVQGQESILSQESTSSAFRLLTTLLKPNPGGDELFGWSVASFGGDILVGAPYDDTGTRNAGAAYLLDSFDGRLIQTFQNPAPSSGDLFARSVGVVDTRILVGAPYEDLMAANAGVTYAFNASSGSLLLTFQKPSPSSGDLFGQSVASLEGRVIVGAPYDDTNGTDAGAVYMFDLDGNLMVSLHNPSPGTGDYFGWSLAAIENKLLVGTPGSDMNAQDAGAVYLFEVSTGNLLATFQKPTPSLGDYFGWSVAGMGNGVFLGAIGDDTGALNSGAVYLFDSVTGTLLRTFANPDPGDADQFGLSIAAFNGWVIVGAPYDDTGAQDSGTAYLFNASSGGLVKVLENPSPALSDYFGWSVSASASIVIVGAPFDDTGADDAGAAYVFELPLCLLEGDVDRDGTVNIVDLVIVGAGFGKAVGMLGFNSDADLNMDGTVNITDLALVGGNFGRFCP